jgi:hypothetical protein
MLWKSIARWAIMAIAVPLAAVGIRKLSESLEARRGKNRTTGLLRKSADGLDFMSGRKSKRALSRASR